jgi:ABC-2 type transport system ATP-binding protein
MRESDRTQDPDRACEPDPLQAPAIVIQQLRKTVGTSFSLGPVSLVVPSGTVCALVGPNGAGKTTLLNLLMGVGPSDGGRASVLGHDIGTAAVAIKRQTAFVSPEISYRAWGTVGRSIDFVRGFYPDWNPQRCEQLLARLGLRRADVIDELSFGGRVKLSLLLALSRNADLLLLDEPSIGLDPLARQVLFAELLGFMQSEARTIVISSNQLTELERFADYVAVMNRGQIVASGATPDLLERYVELDVLLRQDRVPEYDGLHLLARDGDRARLLWDRNATETGLGLDPTPGAGYASDRGSPLNPVALAGLEVIAERSLTLEELFVALVKTNSRVRWQPRMAAA